jgi:soluble lytic murein transglycosylase-like protein
MHVPFQALAILSALAISCALAAASPQDPIVLIHDVQGRAVYVNAAEWRSLSAPQGGRTASTPTGVAEPGAQEPDPAVHKLISRTASSLAVDPRLVEAVVKVESGYDARARSPKGALGLMQLMPATAARFGVQNPFDAAENIRGGVTYLSYLLKQFEGDVPLSLAAYNAGESAVLRRHGIPPFEETQNYVRKVTALYPSFEGATPASGRGQPSMISAETRDRDLTADNAAIAVPIYRYVDTQGVLHFSQ